MNFVTTDKPVIVYSGRGLKILEIVATIITNTQMLIIQ